ncbi:30S ribosomal protein S4 [candidate division TA06 bacterium DG_24]|jgi:small subunit ribosomal protein S4|uniref:Small ribosomal subunit protein uS4 n=3 Tax=Bacteria division TA06 TaxID=1156500 RepID=A0A0S8JN99_UNCT6|nr:MAG: 30S ribosomal protein S4 [candidate division TA06 bacterium DG_24]KPK70888.1 MAG: 30S ribosomal protein S4 [candidate division TA06 bacterium SM23_40]KPL10261.1 MAG: 30S ribosomal protein S4 [candidate division TA06 bacterium SM1_40]
MARYTDARCKLCRREGTKLFLKGERCITEKCAMERRAYPPGERGRDSRMKLSGYGVQLREKQKLRRMYGLLERQFHNYFKKAERMKGVTSELLVQLLERRLDNTVYRLGFAPSRISARQLVRHGHFTVNGKRVDIPSFLLRAGDVVELREKGRSMPLVEASLEERGRRELPAWLSFDRESFRGTMMELPTLEHVAVPVELQQIVELYSK